MNRGYDIHVYPAADLMMMYFSVFGAAVVTYAIVVLLTAALGGVRDK